MKPIRHLNQATLTFPFSTVNHTSQTEMLCSIPIRPQNKKIPKSCTFDGDPKTSEGFAHIQPSHRKKTTKKTTTSPMELPPRATPGHLHWFLTYLSKQNKKQRPPQQRRLHPVPGLSIILIQFPLFPSIIHPSLPTSLLTPLSNTQHTD